MAGNDRTKARDFFSVMAYAEVIDTSIGAYSVSAAVVVSMGRFRSATGAVLQRKRRALLCARMLLSRTGIRFALERSVTESGKARPACRVQTGRFLLCRRRTGGQAPGVLVLDRRRSSLTIACAQRCSRLLTLALSATSSLITADSLSVSALAVDQLGEPAAPAVCSGTAA
jgi:hypothetical protein